MGSVRDHVFSRACQHGKHRSGLEFKASETGVVDETELKAAKNEMGEDKYRQEFECSFDAAVEQQAIDRTHRIGQTKNIFAYRMICKDSIEDKILQLQERKRALAKDIITDDSGFVKSLSREDVEYLFS